MTWKRCQRPRNFLGYEQLPNHQYSQILKKNKEKSQILNNSHRKLVICYFLKNGSHKGFPVNLCCKSKGVEINLEWHSLVFKSGQFLGLDFFLPNATKHMLNFQGCCYFFSKLDSSDFKVDSRKHKLKGRSRGEVVVKWGQATFLPLMSWKSERQILWRVSVTRGFIFIIVL